MPEQHPQFQSLLEVPALLERSRPRARRGWLVPAIAALIILVLGSTYLTSRSAGMKLLVDAVSGLLMFIILVSMALLMWSAVRRQRQERALLESIEKMVQLRRW